MIREFVLWAINDGHKAVADVRTAVRELDNERLGAWVKRNSLEALRIADQAIGVTIESVELIKSIRTDAIEHFNYANRKKEEKKSRFKRDDVDFSTYDFEPFVPFSLEDNED